MFIKAASDQSISYSFAVDCANLKATDEINITRQKYKFITEKKSNKKYEYNDEGITAYETPLNGALNVKRFPWGRGTTPGKFRASLPRDGASATRNSEKFGVVMYPAALDKLLMGSLNAWIFFPLWSYRSSESVLRVFWVFKLLVMV